MHHIQITYKHIDLPTHNIRQAPQNPDYAPFCIWSQNGI